MTKLAITAFVTSLFCMASGFVFCLNLDQPIHRNVSIHGLEPNQIDCLCGAKAHIKVGKHKRFSFRFISSNCIKVCEEVLPNDTSVYKSKTRLFQLARYQGSWEWCLNSHKLNQKRITLNQFVKRYVLTPELTNQQKAKVQVDVAKMIAKSINE